MYLHIGNELIVPKKNIIGIFDMDRTTISKDTRKFLKISDEEGFIKNVSNDIPKSFIVMDSEYNNSIYLTSISPSTLYKRFNSEFKVEDNQ